MKAARDFVNVLTASKADESFLRDSSTASEVFKGMMDVWHATDTPTIGVGEFEIVEAELDVQRNSPDTQSRSRTHR